MLPSVGGGVFSISLFTLGEEIGTRSHERAAVELNGPLNGREGAVDGSRAAGQGELAMTLACDFNVANRQRAAGDGHNIVRGVADLEAFEIVVAGIDRQHVGAVFTAHANLKGTGIVLAGNLQSTSVKGELHVLDEQRIVRLCIGLGLILVTTGIELGDVEDALFTNRHILELVVVLELFLLFTIFVGVVPDGGRELAVGNVHAFIGAALTISERDVGALVKRQVHGKRCAARRIGAVTIICLLFGLDRQFVLRAVERHVDGAGGEVNQAVDIGLFTEVEGGRRSAVLDFNRGRTLGGSVDSAVVFKGVRGGVDQNAVSPLVLTLILVEDFADGDRAVVDADALDTSTAEFEAGTLAFNDDPAVVLDGRRFSAVFGSADEHAVGVLGDDGAGVDGFGAIGGAHGVVLPGGLARHVDLAGVLDRGAVGSPETGGAGVLLNTVHPKRLVEREGLVLFGGAEEGSGGFGILRREEVGVLVKLPISRGGRRGILRSLNPFGSHRGAGHAGDHRRDGSGHDRLRAFALHGGRNFIYNHQGAARLVENNLECRIHVNYSFWEEKTNAKVLLRKLRIAKFQGLVLVGGGKNPNMSK